MVGGGEYGSFINLKTVDQDLIVRSAQCHALMPMMQYSVAPWRILDEVHLKACKNAVQLRMEYTPVILELAKESAKSGEPIVRSMEYVFPHQGYEKISDQFLLGDNILIAPFLNKGEGMRQIVIPNGKWKDDQGKTIKGPKILEVKVDLEMLPVFVKVK
jgi:alpha-glucosidase